MENEKQNNTSSAEEVAATAVKEEQNDTATVKTQSTADAIFQNREVSQPKKKPNWLSTLLFVAVLILTMFLMYKLSASATNGNEKTLWEIFATLRTDYLLAALGTLLAIIFLDSLKYFVIIHATANKFCGGAALKTSLLGKYYDAITPFSSGGQPFQIHYLHSKGFTGGESTAVIFIKYCFNMLCWLFLCFCLMVFNRDAMFAYVTEDSQRVFFTVMGWIGFAVNCLLPLLVISFAIFPKMMETVSRWILTIGHKLKIVKNKDAIVLKAKRISRDFSSAFVLMWKKPLHAIALLLCCLVEPFLAMILPYFVVVSFCGNAITPSAELMFAIMTLNVYVSMSVTVIPTPGNSGAMENAFLLVLTSVAEGVLFWSVFTWRFLTYYLFVIIGLGIVIADFVRKHRRKESL